LYLSLKFFETARGSKLGTWAADDSRGPFGSGQLDANIVRIVFKWLEEAFPEDVNGFHPSRVRTKNKVLGVEVDKDTIYSPTEMVDVRGDTLGSAALDLAQVGAQLLVEDVDLRYLNPDPAQVLQPCKPNLPRVVATASATAKTKSKAEEQRHTETLVGVTRAFGPPYKKLLLALLEKITAVAKAKLLTLCTHMPLKLDKQTVATLAQKLVDLRKGQITLVQEAQKNFQFGVVVDNSVTTEVIERAQAQQPSSMDKRAQARATLRQMDFQTPLDQPPASAFTSGASNILGLKATDSNEAAAVKYMNFVNDDIKALGEDRATFRKPPHEDRPAEVPQGVLGGKGAVRFTQRKQFAEAAAGLRAASELQEAASRAHGPLTWRRSTIMSMSREIKEYDLLLEFTERTRRAELSRTRTSRWTEDQPPLAVAQGSMRAHCERVRRRALQRQAEEKSAAAAEVAGAAGAGAMGVGGGGGRTLPPPMRPTTAPPSPPTSPRSPSPTSEPAPLRGPAPPVGGYPTLPSRRDARDRRATWMEAPLPGAVGPK